MLFLHINLSIDAHVKYLLKDTLHPRDLVVSLSNRACGDDYDDSSPLGGYPD